MTTSRARLTPRGHAINVSIPDGSIEVSTGFGGRGVFLTPISARGRRWVTVSVGWVCAMRLAETIRLAAEAAREAERNRSEPP